MLITSSLSPLFTIVIVLVFVCFTIFISGKYLKMKKQFTAQVDEIEELTNDKNQLSRQLSEFKNIVTQLRVIIDEQDDKHQNYIKKLIPEYRKVYEQLSEMIDKYDCLVEKNKLTEELYLSLLDDNRNLESQIHELNLEHLHLRDNIASHKEKLLNTGGFYISEDSNSTDTSLNDIGSQNSRGSLTSKLSGEHADKTDVML